MSRPCSFHSTPRGCKRGTSCTFLHIGPSGSGSIVPSLSTSTSATPATGTPAVPNGVCRGYWTAGNCTWGSKCKYQHRRPGEPARPSSSSDNPLAETASSGAGGITSSPSPSASATLLTGPLPSVPNGVCRNYWISGNCTWGSKCKYQHRRPGEPEVTSTGDAIPPTPHNVCRLYWTSGSCRHGLACKFNHVQYQEPSAAGQVAPQGAVLNVIRGPPVAALGSSYMDMPPQRAYKYIEPMLRDNFDLRGRTTQIYTFLNVLEGSSGPAWNQDDCQLLLSQIASDDGNGLARIRDIVCFPDVSSSAGTQPTKLSFQRGTMRLLGVSENAFLLHDEGNNNSSQYLSSDSVLKSTLDHRVNALYGVVHNNFNVVSASIERCLTEVFTRKTFADPLQPSQEFSGAVVFEDLIATLLEYVTRYKQAVLSNQEVGKLSRKIGEWVRNWTTQVTKSPPEFKDKIGDLSREAIAFQLRAIETRLDKLLKIIEREEQRATRSSTAAKGRRVESSNEALIAALEATFEGPGTMRRGGPRHDNDAVDIADIRIAPTHGELVTQAKPYLPANLPTAPHHLPSNSMDRLLDIEFRLLREELTAPLRVAVQRVLEDLGKPTKTDTQLRKILSNQGGRYRTDEVMFSIYTGITFHGMSTNWRGLSVAISFDTPPGSARSNTASARETYWSGGSGKRLMQGGLVAIIFKTGQHASIHLATVSGSAENMAASAKRDKKRVSTSLTFFDAAADDMVLERIHRSAISGGERILMLEAPVMFESIRPFLEALRTEPQLVPFGRYLVHLSPGQRVPEVDPPIYAMRPNFKFELSSLLKKDSTVDQQPLHLVVTDPASIETARERLLEDSFLDPSQCTALVDCLVRELALVQGPPGTGKSFMGIQLLRVLLTKVKPILMIAFTNHALDHLLEAVLDANITKNIVRLGTRASISERLSNYSLETLELASNDRESPLDREKRSESYQLKLLRGEIEQLVERIARQDVTEEETEEHLQMMYPEHLAALRTPAPWIDALYERHADEISQGWKKRGKSAPATEQTMFGFWLTATDLDIFFMPTQHETPVDSQPGPAAGGASFNRFDILNDDIGQTGANDEAQEVEGMSQTVADAQADDEVIDDLEHAYMSIQTVADVTALQDPAADSGITVDTFPRTPLEFFSSFNMAVPSPPIGDRPIDDLLLESDVWSMSLQERQRLHTFWIQEAGEIYHTSRVAEFESLRKQFAERQKRFDSLRDQARLKLLQGRDIVGCTTNGAAKLAALMKGLAPKVVLVEEAGQVLEAHILGSLVPSVEHLICIGDPLQLRPTINNYALSMDSRTGAQLYRFDMSLMERLSLAGMSMSQLNVQRRMRPAIADLIRNPTLYPTLEDNEHVNTYPDVTGMAKNVFFMTHGHAENGGGEDSVSKHNMFEVEMIVDLATYLVRQAPQYSEAGAIVVLCAYLGQLVKLREAFSSRFTVVIDERDQELLAKQATDDNEAQSETPSSTAHVERVKMSQRILLRTVDNFQGEEADIIILSLVRNSGELGDAARSSIGFLKSINRTNVALSRARHGLYVLGNSANLAAQSPLWASVIDELYQQDAIGEGFPIFCPRHPDLEPRIAKRPGDLQNFAPDGGCLYPCGARLGCGHTCPSKCHADWTHSAVVCTRDCSRLCPRGHPCTRLCSQPCGDCHFPVADVTLPCGHIVPQIHCYQLDKLSEVRCKVQVRKQLPNCEHSAIMSCSMGPEEWVCRETCNLAATCGHRCAGRCHDCQKLNDKVEGYDRITRTRHVPHRCGRMLFCQHPCAENCGDSASHECTNSCQAACRRVCTHAACQKMCGEPCEPCKEPCTWSCPHHSCPVPCGSPCSRLPCDEPCDGILTCGHICPSVCGEPCAEQKCPQCTPADEADVVDFIMQRNLHDVDPSLGTLDELLITLKCGHCFTVETLDGHCELSQFYEQDPEANWVAPRMPNSTYGFREPPSCPTCRAPITARRYSRAVKRAELDVVERNVAGYMSRQLDALTDELLVLDVDAAQKKVVTELERLHVLRNSDIALPPADQQTMHKKIAERVAKHREDILPPVASAIGHQMHAVFKVPDAEKKVWVAVAGPFTRLYTQAVGIAATRFAHTASWEAALVALYHAELATVPPDYYAPENVALSRAMDKIALPRPRADTRFATEALWQSVELRLTIAHLARVWLENIPTDQANRLALWSAYCAFVLKTAAKDAENALVACRKAENHRQSLRAHLFILRTQFELMSLNLWMAQRKPLEPEIRTKFIAKVQSRAQEATTIIDDALTAYRSTRQRTDVDDAWVFDNFCVPGGKILQAWEGAEDALRSGMNQPLSREDKIMIINSLGFSHAGHFYKCENGHTFVITECGGAMQESRCPECGGIIGGHSHTLNSSNRRDDEMEELSREAGVRASPWAWGR